MKKYLIAFLILFFASPVWAENFCVEVGASWNSAACASDCAAEVAADTCMDISDVDTAGNWDTDDDDDNKIGQSDYVYLSEDGGEFRDTGTGDIFSMLASGTSGKPITFTNYTGDSPVLNGADTVATWTAVAGDTHDYGLDEDYSRTDTSIWFRQRIHTDHITANGEQVQVCYTAPSTGNMVITGSSIGIGESGDPDYTAAPTRITFDTGNNGKTVTASSTECSDWMTYTYDSSSYHWVHIQAEDVAGTVYLGKNTGATTVFYDFTGASDDTMVQDVTADSTTANAYGIDTIEVKTADVYQATLTTAPAFGVFMVDADETIHWGDQEASIAVLAAEYDWFWASNVLYVYAPGDPDTEYAEVEVGARIHGFDTEDEAYIVIDGIEMKFSTYDGVRLRNSVESGNNTVRNCTLHHFGDAGTEGTQGAGIMVRQSDATIEYNTIYEVKRGISLHAYDQNADDNIVQYNKIYDFYYLGAQAIVETATKNADRNIFRYNYVYQSSGWSTPATGLYTHGVSGDNTDYTYFYGNIVWNTGSNIKTNAFADNVYIIGNTLYDTGTGTYYSVEISGANTATVQNNIGVAANTVNLWIADKTNKTVDNNIWYKASGDFANVDSTTYDETEFAAYQSATGFDTNGLYVDQDLTDEANGDFSVKSTSPGIDRGALVAGYGTKLRNDTVIGDFGAGGDVNLVPVGNGDDIGAMEYPIWGAP
jgi:hypothetical protein